MDPKIKTWASQLMSTLDMTRIRRERPDEARMLEILASSGGAGLVRAREAVGVGDLVRSQLLRGAVAVQLPEAESDTWARTESYGTLPPILAAVP